MTPISRPMAVTNGAEELHDDFRGVIDDAQDLVKNAAERGGEKMTAVRARVDQGLKVAQQKMTDTQEAVLHRARAEAHATNAYVHENPWQMIGVAAGFGLLLGLALSKR